MAFVINDRVKETTTTTGTGTLNLAGAPQSFETFVAGIGNTNTTYYCITQAGSTDFEVGLGTVTDSTPDTLSRDTVISSSNSDAAVNFGAGTKDVFCTLPASKAIVEDGTNNISVGNNITVGGTVDGVDIASRDTVLTNTTTTANAALPKGGGTMTGNIVFDSGQPTGNSGLVPAAGTSGHFLAHNGAFSQVGYANVSGTPTIPGGATSIHFNDNVKATFGDSGTPDLEIYHDTNNSIIEDDGTGSLILRSNNTVIQNAAGDENVAAFAEDGAVTLYHNNSAKLATSASGVTVTGTLTATTLAGSFPYGSLTGAPTIPTNNNQLTNGAGYTTNTGTLTQVTSGGATTVSAGNGIGLNTGNGTITMSGSYSGSFSATGNLTAYSSDERLKNFKGKIENALDKVDRLSGYYYEWNDIAKGIDAEAFKDSVEVGVNAQEVEEVMPEVVTEAPIVDIHNLDTNYKTVYYDKIVPLLIEAIKELKSEIEKLKKDK